MLFVRWSVKNRACGSKHIVPQAYRVPQGHSGLRSEILRQRLRMTSKEESLPPSGVILRVKPEGSQHGEALLRSEILRRRLRMTGKEESLSPPVSS